MGPAQCTLARDKVAPIFSAESSIMRRTSRLAVQIVLSLAALIVAAPSFAAKAKSEGAKSAAKSEANVALPAGADTLIWRGDHATGRTIMDELAREYAKEKKGRITLEPFSTISGLDAVAQGTA